MSMPLRILNLDDNEAARYARSRNLIRAGYEVLEASNGEEALHIAQAALPDVAILDVKLPDMSGLEVTQRIKTDPRTARILVVQVSAVCVEESDEIVSLQRGADIYLRYPEDFATLPAVIDTLVRLRKAESVRLDSVLAAGAIQQACTVGVAQFDLSGYVSQSNQRFCALLQRTPAQLCTMSVGQLAHPEDAERVTQAFDALVRGHAGDFRIGARFSRADGSWLWADCSFSLVRSATGVARGAVGLLTEVAESKSRRHDSIDYFPPNPTSH